MAIPNQTAAPPVTAPNQAEHRRHWVTVAEAAEHLGVTIRTIRQMIADGRLTAYRNGNRLVRIDLGDLDASMTPYGGGV